MRAERKPWDPDLTLRGTARGNPLSPSSKQDHLIGRLPGPASSECSSGDRCAGIEEAVVGHL